MSGSIVMVGTPIGNLGDLSARATAALGTADVIACEDTRRTGKLLELAGVERKGRFVVLNDHTVDGRIDDLVRQAASGAMVAVVSDAGMPGISDPGERLVAAAIAGGVGVEVVPGPSAVLAALVMSGLPAGRFCFEGFLPRKGSARLDRLEVIANELRTTVLFESPHRLAATLADLAEVVGPERRVVVVRELTKLHEETWRGPLGDATRHFRDEPVKGEVTLVMAGAPMSPGAEISDDDLEERLRTSLADGGTVRDAVDAVTEQTSLPRRRVYGVARRMDRG